MNLFKTCTSCKTPWFSREEFLADDDIEIIGYQVNFGDLVLGLFLFNHSTCQSTFGIPAGLFRDLYSGPVFSKCLTGSQQCPGFCLHPEILQACRAKCEGAYVREILQILRDWPKEINVPVKIAAGQY
ncbi:MAG: hypothetical protein PVF37_21770 [Desulfobacterales bacterium]|jgi:hypothetical protein